MPAKPKAKPPADAVLSQAAAEVIRLAGELHSSETRNAWTAIGYALLRARNASVNQMAFGVWIAANKIADLPGLASPASRSDAIWLAERQDCANLISAAITHPRRVRMTWRKLLAQTAVEVLAQEDPDPTEDAVAKIMLITAATEPEAIAALAAAKVVSGTAAVGSGPSWSPSLEPLKAALKKAKKSAITHQALGIAVVEVYGGHAIIGPGPAAGPQIDLQVIGLLIKKHGKAPTLQAVLGYHDRATALATLNNLLPPPHRTAVEIYDALKAALAEAEAAGVLLDEAKDAVMGVYWGIEKVGGG